MARIINRTADVSMGPGGAPVSFRWGGGRWQRVREVLDCWVESGRWWELESEKTTYRVATATGGIHELTWDPAAKRWCLYKSYD